MLFSSNEFVFVFLPITVLLFYGLRRLGGSRSAFVSLLIASLIFYSYWSTAHGLLFFASIIVNYAVGLALMRTRSRPMLVAGAALNLGLLGYFKYFAFFVTQANDLLGTGLTVPLLVLPIGISFYTFQQTTFLVDCYRGHVSESSFIRYGLFVSFFPHLIAGPITHHAEMMPQFDRVRLDRVALNMALGTGLFAIGLSKKIMIADPLGAICSPIFDGVPLGIHSNIVTAWIAALAYTFQIYFDFSGYSDMAYGLALMFGIRLPVNFYSPYKSRSIVDFWRRWHITLSRLLRDYVYVPLGGNRKGPTRRYVNLFLTMALGGLWHGAGWTFVFWGVLHGSYLVINHVWNAWRPLGSRLLPFAGTITFFAVLAAWVPFRALDFATASDLYASMLGFKGVVVPLEISQIVNAIGIDLARFGIGVFSENDRSDFYLGIGTVALAGCIAFFAPNSIQLTRAFHPALYVSQMPKAPLGWMAPLRWRPSVLSGLACGGLLFAAIKMMNAAPSSAFLYFQF